MAKQINTVLSLKDKISQPLVKVSKNVDKVTRDMKKSQNQIEKWKNKSVKAMDNVIKKSAKAGLAVGAAVGALATKVGFDGLKELDAGAAKVKSIAKESLNLKDIQEDLLKQSNKTGIVVEALAETQYSAISSGVKAAESMQAAVQASKLAVSGFTDSDNALKIMTSTMNVYGLTGVDAMESISDKLLVTQNLGVTTVAELANSLGSLTPVAKSAGAGIDDLMAGMAALTKNGLKTEEAVTSYKGILTSVIKPTKDAAETAKKLGIDFSTSAIKSKGMVKFMEEIKEKTGGNTEVMGKLFGNVRALSGALILAGDGIDDFNVALDAMENSAGATDEAYKTMTNTIGFKMDKMKNRVKNTFTAMMNTQSGAIGENIDKIDAWLENNEEKIQGWIQSIGEGVTQMIDFVRSVVDFIQRHEKAITTIGVFVLTMYSVIKVTTTLKKTLENLKTIGFVANKTLKLTSLSWTMLAIAGVVAVGYALYRNWDLVKEKAGDLSYGVQAAFRNMGTGIKNVFKGIGNFFIDWVVNPIIKGLNMISFDIPDWVPKFGGKKFGFNLKTVNTFEYDGFESLKKLKQASNSSINIGAGQQISAFAKGTSYSPAGYARIHEEGGEIRKLSSGETIIPADKSERLLRGKGTGQDVNIIIKILGNVIGNQEFIDEIGYEVYRKIVLALENI